MVKKQGGRIRTFLAYALDDGSYHITPHRSSEGVIVTAKELGALENYDVVRDEQIL